MKYYVGFCKRVPRKIKKFWLGNRLSASKLRRKNRLVKIKDDKGDSLFLDGVQVDYCPYCGCETYTFFDYHAEYPEQYWDLKCNRCGKTVWSVDNSYPFHALSMMKDE